MLSDLALCHDGYVDQFDDWVSEPSWSGSYRLTESDDPHLRVNLRVRVYGKANRRWRSKVYPQSWWAYVECDGLNETVATGRCRTLKEALAAVKALDFTESVRTLWRRVYAPQRAYRVYRKAERPSVWGIVSDRGAWEPWLTTFGYLTAAGWDWPWGTDYLAVRGDERILVRRTSCSISTSSIRPEESGQFDWLSQEGAA